MIARIFARPILPVLLIVLASTIVFAALAYFFFFRPPSFAPILLRGTIVTPDSVLPQGWILIKNGHIEAVSEQKPASSGAIEVDTNGIIFPGLIDLHNHVSWNVFPRWDAGGTFSDPDQWRNTPDYQNKIGLPYNHLIDAGKFCDMNTYGELRALVGGVTSILATASSNCIAGLVRNLDNSSGFYTWPANDSQHIVSDVFFPQNPQAILNHFQESGFRAYLLHVAEGSDAAARQQFTQLTSSGLLTAKTVIVHGSALVDVDFQAMDTAGASLVWSPRSNVELYGETTDVRAAINDGVRVALAPDWAITGSSNLLDEVRYAADWNANSLDGFLTDQQLVAMVTSVPAAMVGIDDKVGAIRQGAYADLVVISGDAADPYGAFVQSSAQNVQLVLINGTPIYGDPDLMAHFWTTSDLVSMSVLGAAKMLRMPQAGDSFDALQQRLSGALSAQNSPLAPIAEALS
ncbi:MAG: amidohydrolase family protein [Chloroflexota bacterium]